MKYLLLILLLLPLFTHASFDVNLQYGSQGKEVVKLQNFLRDQNTFDGESTGNFYNVTKIALIAFQLREWIVPAAGYFGPLTRERANEILREQVPPQECTTIPHRVIWEGTTYDIGPVIETPTPANGKNLRVEYYEVR